MIRVGLCVAAAGLAAALFWGLVWWYEPAPLCCPAVYSVIGLQVNYSRTE